MVNTGRNDPQISLDPHYFPKLYNPSKHSSVLVQTSRISDVFSRRFAGSVSIARRTELETQGKRSWKVNWNNVTGNLAGRSMAARWPNKQDSSKGYRWTNNERTPRAFLLWGRSLPRLPELSISLSHPGLSLSSWISFHLFTMTGFSWRFHGVSKTKQGCLFCEINRAGRLELKRKTSKFWCG